MVRRTGQRAPVISLKTGVKISTDGDGNAHFEFRHEGLDRMKEFSCC